jgi:glycosyltransferase involved in cell wall biosynthesis
LSVTYSIVIPARDESDRIASGFARLQPVLEQLGVDDVEVIIVDDGSSDDTGRRAAEIYGVLPHCLVVRQEENRGKGAAVRLGLAIATGQKVAACDADMSISPAHLPALFHALDGAEVAVGSRTVDGGIHYTSPLRTVAGNMFNHLVRRRVGTTIRDTQCGFKAFRTPAARLLASLSLVDGFAFDVEMLYLAGKLGFEVQEVPVTWDDVEGSSVRVLRDSRRMLRDIRGLRVNVYECPVVRVAADVEPARVAELARAARITKPVLAIDELNALVVLPRDGALAGLDLAAELNGTLGVGGVEDFLGRRLVAV